MEKSSIAWHTGGGGEGTSRGTRISQNFNKNK